MKMEILLIETCIDKMMFEDTIIKIIAEETLVCAFILVYKD